MLYSLSLFLPIFSKKQPSSKVKHRLLLLETGGKRNNTTIHAAHISCTSHVTLLLKAGVFLICAVSQPDVHLMMNKFDIKQKLSNCIEWEHLLRLCASYTWDSSCNVHSHHDSQSEAHMDGQGLPQSPFTQHRLGHWTTSKELGQKHKREEVKEGKKISLFLIIPITPTINTSLFCPPTASACHRQFFWPKIMKPPFSTQLLGKKKEHTL